ncbi:MAG: hypothetical protein HC781_15795 [Leptolyngbyaceae cyanobacterium CSU_1_4]|nr:hypothetical protein [Leptolyngbyaceae cyanobacterium CSU_1_4]
MYPIYALFQTGRLLGRQMGQAARRVFPQLRAAQQQILNFSKPNSSKSNSSALSLSEPYILFSDTPIQNLLAQNCENSSISLIQGFASLLENRELVLVTVENEILNVLTGEQQLQLQRQMIWEMAMYWRHRKIQDKIQAAPEHWAPLPSWTNTFLPLPQEKKNLLPPIRAFRRLMTWIQLSPVAIALNLFQESHLAALPAAPEPSREDFSLRSAQLPEARINRVMQNFWNHRQKLFNPRLNWRLNQPLNQPLNQKLNGQLNGEDFPLRPAQLPGARINRVMQNFWNHRLSQQLNENVNSQLNEQLNERVNERVNEQLKERSLKSSSWLAWVKHQAHEVAEFSKSLGSFLQSSSIVLYDPLPKSNPEDFSSISPSLSPPLSPPLSQKPWFNLEDFLGGKILGATDSRQIVKRGEMGLQGRATQEAIGGSNLEAIAFSEPQTDLMRSSSSSALHPSASPEEGLTSTILEAEVTGISYEKHPLEQLLQWLDQGMLWIEQKLEQVWHWLHRS